MPLRYAVSKGHILTLAGLLVIYFAVAVIVKNVTRQPLDSETVTSKGDTEIVIYRVYSPFESICKIVELRLVREKENYSKEKYYGDLSYCGGRTDVADSGRTSEPISKEEFRYYRSLQKQLVNSNKGIVDIEATKNQMMDYYIFQPNNQNILEVFQQISYCRNYLDVAMSTICFDKEDRVLTILRVGEVMVRFSYLNCSGNNKELRYLGFANWPTCVQIYSDGGKLCRSGKDCQSGFCYAYESNYEYKIGEEVTNAVCTKDDTVDCFSEAGGSKKVESGVIAEDIPICD